MKSLLPILLLTLAPVFAANGQHTHASDRVIDFPDVPGYVTVTTDLHVHTVFSDGDVWPNIRVEEAVRDGLDAVAVTDHLEYQPHKADIPHPDRNRSYEIAVDAAEGEDLIVIRGSEITRSMPPGHSNAVFIQDANPILQDDAMEAFREAGRQGAFIFWNHPMWTAQVKSGVASLTEMHRELIREDLLHGIEVVNHHSYSDEALQIALDHDLTIIGTSDIHGLVDWDYHVHEGGHRPVTLVFAEERTAESVRQALFDGRTTVWHDNTLVGKEEFVVPLVHASLSVRDAAYQGDSSVLDVYIANTSDVSYTLQSRDAYTFDSSADLVTVAPHETTRLQVRTLERRGSIQLVFEVLNAVTAPGQHPVVTFDVPVGS